MRHGMMPDTPDPIVAMVGDVEAAELSEEVARGLRRGKPPTVARYLWRECGWRDPLNDAGVEWRAFQHHVRRFRPLIRAWTVTGDGWALLAARVWEQAHLAEPRPSRARTRGGGPLTASEYVKRFGRRTDAWPRYPGSYASVSMAGSKSQVPEADPHASSSAPGSAASGVTGLGTNTA